MNKYKSLEDFIEKNKDLFAKHVGTYTKIPTGKWDAIIRWKDPKTNNGHMTITYINGYLSITGDYGNASWTWYNPKNTIEWMASRNTGYFMEKCKSAEIGDNGRWMMIYDQNECIETVEKYIDEYELEIPEPEYSFEDWRKHTSDKHEWHQFLREEGNKIFGDDHCEWTYDAGNILHPRVYVWQFALRSMVAWFKEKYGENWEGNPHPIEVIVPFTEFDIEQMNQGVEMEWSFPSTDKQHQVTIKFDARMIGS